MTSFGFGQGKQKKIHLKSNPELMRQELLKLIPIGHDIQEAKRLMEANKFYCEMVKDRNFTTGTEDKPNKEHNNLNFLSCERKRNTLNPKRLLYLHWWRVAFVQKEDVITDTLVYVGWFSDL